MRGGGEIEILFNNLSPFRGGEKRVSIYKGKGGGGGGSASSSTQPS